MSLCERLSLRLMFAFYRSLLFSLLVSLFRRARSTDPLFSCLSVRAGDARSVPGGVDYAEIVVVRHGETAWNADGRIQVFYASGILFSLLIL